MKLGNADMETLDFFRGGPYAPEKHRNKAEKLVIVETDQDYSEAIRFAMKSSRRRISVILGRYAAPSEAHASDSDLIIRIVVERIFNRLVELAEMIEELAHPASARSDNHPTEISP